MSAPDASNKSSPRFIVACLCAEWCSSCREYRETFNQVARDFPAVRFLWIDIEDHAAVTDGIDVENFPTLLIASDKGLRFFGPLTPQMDVLVRLVRANVDDESAPLLNDPCIEALVARLRALHSG